MPIPAASSWEELLDFEEQFEAAALAVIAGAAIPALVAKSAEEPAELNCAVNFIPGAATGSRQLVAGRQEYDRYVGVLELEVSGTRPFDAGSETAGVSTRLAEVRAKLRNLFRESQWPFNDDNLPFYRVSRLQPDGTVNGIIEATMQDTVLLRFKVEFGIQPGAWPG